MMPHVGKNVYGHYDHARIALALDAVRSGRCTQRNAAKEFGIPRTTIGDRLRGKIADDARSGSSTVLPKT